ncbi:hypothetical protein ACQP2F_01145 [Actinoplanes sp. CA-030573]|uniref:hypothetical protein n=1 Tax=Actinoplanes sp. CA-030573 TaxID=3239898 RepID=UPI003D92537C
MTTLLGNRRLWWIAAGAAVVLAGVVVWLVARPGDDPVRERRYRAESACLLTGEQGIRGLVASQVWAGMQRASLETKVQVTFLDVPGAASAGAMLAGLSQGHCDLLLAVDAEPVAAVAEGAKTFPGQRFAVVGGAAAANVTVLDGTADAAYGFLTREFTD